jgi:hypothetical protein
MTLLKQQLSLLLPPALAVLALASCTPTGGGPIVDTPRFSTCDASDQCPSGHVCNAGSCVLGTCDPLLETACDVDGLGSPYCCKPWELCSTLSFTCQNDPDVRGIGCPPDDESCTPCQEQDDCAAGQFCSGGACFDAAGRDACTSSFQCRGGERCDRNVFLCVPDRGGCTFCGPAFSELCCEEGQVCSQQTGFCLDLPDPECNIPGAETCPVGLLCDDLQRCVQCITDADCGPNLACDEGPGDCFSLASFCESDADCLGNKRCATARQECVIPECTTDNDCRSDPRKRCDVGQLQCFLPPAVCTEDDEPNNSVAEATPLVDGVSYAGTLCRADSDFLTFPVRANKRYTATVDFGGSGQGGITVAMLDSSQVVESSATFSATQRSVQVAGVTGPAESGFFYLKITGSNTSADRWTYTVSVREDEPSPPADCSAGGQPEEPNDDFAEATTLVPGQTRVFSRCGAADVDFYRIPLRRLHSLEVIVAGFFNAEGNINVELYRAPNLVTGRVDQGTSINDVEIVRGVEGPEEYYLRVQLGSAAGAVTNQTYTITANEVPRPAACDADPNEDDGLLESAVPLTLQPDGQGNPGVRLDNLIRCNPQDVDLFRFSMPPNLGGVVMLRFSHNEGDMALDLLDAAGNQLATSNVSNANTEIDEQVTIPGSATETIEYVARARLATSTGGTIGQIYSLEVQTFDNAQCIASEPSGGDDTFATGRCIGSAASYPGTPFPCSGFTPEPLIPPNCATAPAGTPGCGRACGSNDSDFYRVGLLKNQQVLRAVLVFDRTQGLLDLVRSSISPPNTSVSETTISDSDNDGRIEFSFVETSTIGREYAVRVKPRGTTGHQLQPYRLEIEVGAECTADGDEPNERPSTATVISPASLPRTLNNSRCNNDTDVFELILLQGETLTFELDLVDPSPGGLQAELGLRPADLAQIPPAVVTATAGGAPQQFTSNVTQTVYITVRPAPGRTVTGPYQLQLRKQ